MARRWFQLHLSTAFALFLCASVMIGVDIYLLEDGRTSPNGLNAIIFAAIEVLMLLYPAIMIEAWMRRRESGRTLKMWRSTSLVIVLGACLFLITAGFPIFNFSLYFPLGIRGALLAFGMNLYLWIIGVSWIAYLVESKASRRK